MPAFGIGDVDREVYLEDRLGDALREIKKQEIEIMNAESKSDLVKRSAIILSALAAYHAAREVLATLMFVEAADGRTVSVTIEGDETTWESEQIDVGGQIAKYENYAGQLVVLMEALVDDGIVREDEVAEYGVHVVLQSRLMEIAERMRA